VSAMRWRIRSSSDCGTATVNGARVVMAGNDEGCADGYAEVF